MQYLAAGERVVDLSEIVIASMGWNACERKGGNRQHCSLCEVSRLADSAHQYALSYRRPCPCPEELAMIASLRKWKSDTQRPCLVASLPSPLPRDILVSVTKTID